MKLGQKDSTRLHLILRFGCGIIKNVIKKNDERIML